VAVADGDGEGSADGEDDELDDLPVPARAVTVASFWTCV
jgi:hypothetical protein